mgnify:CR=1 FL=1
MYISHFLKGGLQVFKAIVGLEEYNEQFRICT